MAERKTVLVRLRPALYAALRRWAADEFRSLNAQIEFVLRQAAAKAGRLRAENRKPEDGNRKTEDGDTKENPREDV